MARITFLVLLAALNCVWFEATLAQQPTKTYRIGWLSTRPVSRSGGGSDVIRQELHKLGYIEGKNVVFENRSTGGNLDRLPALAAELIGVSADLLLAYSTPSARALKKATGTIPIVFISAGDPVAGGLVDDLARPGGNITGFSTISSMIVGKRLELLKETLPKLTRVAVLWSRQGSALQWKESQSAAQKLGLQLHSMEVSSVDRYESAFEEAVKAGFRARCWRECIGQFQSQNDRRLGRKTSPAGNLSARGLHRPRRADVLWRRSKRALQARGVHDRQDPQRDENR